MAHLEKRLRARAPEFFTQNGSTRGLIRVASALGFKVKQKVIIAATGLPNLELEIKQIDSINEIYVGPRTGAIHLRTDISQYTVLLGANIFANEQQAPSIPEQEVERITYEEEPVVARRVFIVDDLGDPYNSDNPFPVDAIINVDSINIDLDAKTGDNVAISAHPNSIFSQASSSIVTDDFTEIFSFTSTDVDTKIVAIDATVSTSSRIIVKLNGTIIKEMRSSSLERNVTIAFHEHRPLTTGQTITVEAKVDRKIWPEYNAFVSMDAYRA